MDKERGVVDEHHDTPLAHSKKALLLYYILVKDMATAIAYISYLPFDSNDNF